ncbi:hypothetical protein DXV75_11400 [Alteromonas aestuariivivens]|uniref:Uncharacterized protein n=1 Tax=Alteromonas aestuariivivens TaxID=1938339 RepID=A0A3D8M643_9ALTE|nr:hypothetical protein DXV75_11400 [Alteromonas aestuariivivens]
MLVLVMVAVLSSVFYYIEAVKSGLNARNWALAGLLLGPLLFPMFTVSRHVAWRRSTGFNNLYLRA